MALAVVVSDEEPGLTATQPTVGRDQFALELEKVFEQHYQFVYRTAYSLTAITVSRGGTLRPDPALPNGT